jgi:hypothetical protein
MLELLIILQAYSIHLRFLPILLVWGNGGKITLLDASEHKQIFFPSPNNTVIGVHQTSHSMDIDGFFAGNEAVGGVRPTTQLHLVQRFKNDWSIGLHDLHHLSSSHGVYFISKQLHIPIRYLHTGLLFPVRWNSSVSKETRPCTDDRGIAFLLPTSKRFSSLSKATTGPPRNLFSGFCKISGSKRTESEADQPPFSSDQVNNAAVP